MNSQTKQTLRAIIVDDESLGRDVVRHMLESHPEIEPLRECANGLEALDAVNELKPDLIFLDIKMPGMDGIELARKLEDGYCPVIVFTTAYNQYAIKAFEQNAIDYLLKPFDQERFDQMIERVQKRFSQKADADFGRKLKNFLSNDKHLANSDSSTTPETARKELSRIVVKENGRMFFVSPPQVDYFEASGNYVALHIKGRTHLVYDTLTKMEEKLDTESFLRIHRSTIVNIDRIKELQPHFNGEYIVILKDETRLKLSRSYREKARKQLGLD